MEKAGENVTELKDKKNEEYCESHCEGEEPERKPLRKRMISEIMEWAGYILVVIALTFVINTYVGQRTYISGPSMQPTLYDGDNLIVDKISYRFHEPKRYDIIVFPYQYMENTYYIKRIIGLPGETVQIKDGYVYIGDKKLDEHYGAEVMERAGIAEEPIKLGDDEYFVLGDNRNHSSDSRDPNVGVLKREDLIGKAWVRIWPLNKFGVIRHE